MTYESLPWASRTLTRTISFIRCSCRYENEWEIKRTGAAFFSWFAVNRTNQPAWLHQCARTLKHIENSHKIFDNRQTLTIVLTSMALVDWLSAYYIMLAMIHHSMQFLYSMPHANHKPFSLTAVLRVKYRPSMLSKIKGNLQKCKLMLFAERHNFFAFLFHFIPFCWSEDIFSRSFLATQWSLFCIGVK
jgi:hypothetical protein